MMAQSDSDYFDLYIQDHYGALIYFRSGCSTLRTWRNAFDLRIEPASRLDLIGFRK